MAKPINKKYLAGLTFRTNQVIDGADGRRFIPVERELTQDDVLNWREEGSVLVIITADGRKQRVERNIPDTPAPVDPPA